MITRRQPENPRGTVPNSGYQPRHDGHGTFHTVATYGTGRVCAWVDCDTRLSQYNPGSRCSQHEKDYLRARMICDSCGWTTYRQWPQLVMPPCKTCGADMRIAQSSLDKLGTMVTLRSSDARGDRLRFLAGVG